MKRTTISAATYILAAVLAVLLFISSAASSVLAYADEPSNFDSTNVLDDLEGSTIDGKLFELEDYGFDESKNLQVISFVEYCYSFYSDKQQDYGLYIYIYNPQGLNVQVQSTYNTITLSVVGDQYAKYPLSFLNMSTQSGYEGMFYKFKIDFTDKQRDTILNLLHSGERVYKVSEIELLIGQNFTATSFEVANTYTYTGYSINYGPGAATQSSLSCVSSGLLTLTLDVENAAYTPEGTNGKNNYTSDMLYCVYFSVPDTIVEEYGGISKIYAMWLNAVTKPIFVTTNSTVYDAIFPDLGREIPDHLTYREQQPYGFNSNIALYNTALSYNGSHDDYNINPLYFMFPATDENSFINEDGQYVLSGDVVLEYIREYSSDHPSTATVAGKYSSELFSQYDSDYTYVEIEAKDEFTLTNQKLDYGFWDYIKQSDPSYVVSTDYEDINAIHQVKSSDITNDPDETCQHLYINRSYYDEFKSYYDNAIANNETVYLFRYYLSDYICSNANATQWIGTWLQPGLYDGFVDGQHYVAQEHIIIDFDIIKVRFTKGEVHTEIPVVMSPVDFSPDLEPPYVGEPPVDWWTIAILGAVSVGGLIVTRIIKSQTKKAREG